MFALVRRYVDIVLPLSLAVLSLIFHLNPFRLFGSHPFGYDTGFYRRYLIEPFTSFPNAPVPGLGDDALVPRILFDILRSLHLPTDVILYGTYVIFFALLPVLVYFFLYRNLGRRGAVLAAILIIFSSVQYNAFSFFLWKNAFALCLLFSAFIALERRALFALIPLEIALALSHKTTAIIYVLTLAVLMLWRSRRWEMLLHAALTGAVLLAVNFSLIEAVARVRPVALFLDWNQFLWLCAPFTIVLLAANIRLRTMDIPRSLMAFSVVSLAFPILHLPFYERVFIFADIALALFAAYAVMYLISQLDFTEVSWKPWLYAASLCIFFGFYVGSILSEMRALGPLLSEASIERIERIGTFVTPGATILTSANEAPWFEGWTHAHIAAPGMLRDTHSLEEWQALWNATSSEVQIEFLGDFDHPLYIATLDDFQYLIGEPVACLKRITPQLYRDDCER